MDPGENNLSHSVAAASERHRWRSNTDYSPISCRAGGAHQHLWPHRRKGQVIVTRVLITALSFLIWQPPLLAHGGVVAEKDVCIITIGFLQAHFTVHQPLTTGDKEFCEDIPQATKTVFVMDYRHDFLNEMPVDFRIIRDVQNSGTFVNWKDISPMQDLDKITVFYQAPIIRPAGVLSIEHDFQEAGSYIGIVTARHPTKNKVYNAVFQFQVGGGRYPYVPLFIFLMALVQVVYWVSRRGAQRFSRRQ